METTSNKTIIAGFYREVVRERKSELIPQYIHENYIQHSPMGKDGRQGLTEMVEFLKTLPPIPENEPSPIIHLVEHNELVIAHLELHFMGKRIGVMEMFRVKDGKSAEHWEVTEELTDATQPYIKLHGDYVIINEVDFLKDLYKQLNITIHRIVTEGDLVAVLAQARDGGTSIASFDIYQFNGGKATGHWSVKQPVPDEMPHNNGMF